MRSKTVSLVVVSTVCVFSVLLSRAESNKRDDSVLSAVDWPRVAPAHREAPDNQPGPPSLLGTRTVQSARVWSRGRFTSVQVNVDEFGGNIVGDAANESSMAIDPTNPNNIVIGWRQFDTISSNFRTSGYGYSHDGGLTWTFPGVLEPGEFSSDPVLDFDLDGNIYYNALQPDRGPGDWACYVYKTSDGGVTWPQEVYAYGGDKQWMTFDRTGGIGSGNLYMAWSPWGGCCGSNLFTRSTDGGLTFMDPIPIPQDPFWGTLTVGPDGELYISGTYNWPNGPFMVVKSTNAQDPLTTPTFDFATPVSLDGWIGYSAGPNPGGLLGQVWVACDHSTEPTRGNVYLLCSVERQSVVDPLDVMFSRSEDGGSTWSDPVRVNDDPQGNDAWQWFGTMSVAPNGRIDVVWNDTRNTGAVNLSELFYAFSDDAGISWSANIPISPVFDSFVGWPQQNKLGDYYDMISDNTGASLAYAATFNGEQDVYFVRIEPDSDAPAPPQPAPGAVTKGRYISFVPRNPGEQTALRVTLTDLPAQFEGSEGITMWVGPPHEISEQSNETGDTPPPVFLGASLQCEEPPPYMDWGSVGVVYVFDDEIVPNARYDVQAIYEGHSVVVEGNYSMPLPVPTSACWGDVVGDWSGTEWMAPDGDADFDDIAAVVDKFRNLPGAPSKTRADLADDVPDLLVNFNDISAAVDAFRGLPYPFDGPAGCP
ncbi:MAG: hypothetical protein WBE26_08570 [Phycisphaerae bacterium]